MSSSNILVRYREQQEEKVLVLTQYTFLNFHCSLMLYSTMDHKFLGAFPLQWTHSKRPDAMERSRQLASSQGIFSLKLSWSCHCGDTIYFVWIPFWATHNVSRYSLRQFKFKGNWLQSYFHLLCSAAKGFVYVSIIQALGKNSVTVTQNLETKQFPY